MGWAFLFLADVGNSDFQDCMHYILNKQCKTKLKKRNILSTPTHFIELNRVMVVMVSANFKWVELVTLSHCKKPTLLANDPAGCEGKSD